MRKGTQLSRTLSLCSDRAVRSSLPREGRSRGHVYLFIAYIARPATWPLPPAREGEEQEEDGVGAIVGGAALPTTTRTGRPRERREPAVRCSRGLLQWTRTPLGHRWPRRAIPKRSGRRLHPRSQPAHSSCRAGPSAPATRRLSGCTQHIGTRRPACTDSASYVSSACLLSGTGSRFGTSGTCMSGLPPAGPVPPARVENNDILCVFPTNETRHKR